MSALITFLVVFIPFVIYEMVMSYREEKAKQDKS